MLKRTLSIILAVAMLCTLVPAYALAEEVEEAAVVENEEIVVADELVEEDLEVAPMADPFDTTTLKIEGVQQPVGIKMPATIANYLVDYNTDRRSRPDESVLPANSITYVLVDTNNANASNFTAELDDEADWCTTGSTPKNPWINKTGYDTRRSADANLPSVHTATIVVPESVGEEGKEFQIVSANIRTAVTGEPGRFDFVSTRGTKVWIDDVPVTVDQAKGHDVLANLQSHVLWKEKGLVDWDIVTEGGATYYMWDWGPIVTLTPGVHEIKYTPAGGSNGGRMPGLIITDAVGFDWSVVSPIPKKGYIFENHATQMAADFERTFGAAGYLDFAGPEFEGEIVVDAEQTTASSITFTIPEATDVAETNPGSGTFVPSKYATYAPIVYKAYVNEKEFEIGEGGVVTVDGLAPDTNADVLVTATDMLGNTSELEATVKTAGAETLDYAFFAANAEIRNVTTIADAQDKLMVEWDAATAGTLNASDDNPIVVTYNVYVDGELVKEGLEVTKATITGLETANTYNIKVVTCTNGVEATEEDIASSIEADLSTAKDPYLTVVEESTTSTSAVLAASSRMDASAFDFAIKEVIVNGVVVDTATVAEGTNLITVNGLIAGATNTIKITTVETQKSSGDSDDVVYPVITVETPIDNNFTLTPDQCIPVASKLPLPMCYDTLSASQWPVEPSNTNGAGLWDKNQVWRTDKGNATATVSISEAGKYYAFTQSYQYDSARYFKAKINGSMVKGVDGSDFTFGQKDVPADKKTSVCLSICDKPLDLAVGNTDIVLGSGSGIVRANFFALIPASYAYDADGALLDEAGEYASIRKFINENLGVKNDAGEVADAEARQKFMSFYVPDSRILNESSVSVQGLTETSALVKWAPTTFALGKDITYTISVDGVDVANVKSTQPPQYVLDLKPGRHTIAVKASADKDPQAVSTLVGGVIPEVVIDKEVVDEKTGVVTLNSITVNLQNVTGTDKNVALLVATFAGNKMTINAVATVEDLTYGKPDTITVSDLALTTTLVDQAAALDSKNSVTKIFIVDADTFVPYVYLAD